MFFKHCEPPRRRQRTELQKLSGRKIDFCLKLSPPPKVEGVNEGLNHNDLCFMHYLMIDLLLSGSFLISFPRYHFFVANYYIVHTVFTEIMTHSSKYGAVNEESSTKLNKKNIINLLSHYICSDIGSSISASRHLACCNSRRISGVIL